MKYAVIGAGRCGQAIAYDLAIHGQASEIYFVDTDHEARSDATARLKRLCPGVDIKYTNSPALSWYDCIISSAPYKVNVGLAKQAVESGTNFCDLGGNTGVVRQQLALHDDAVEASISVIPDCGMAPGLVNILASMGVASVQGAKHVRIKCGGLPVDPRGPLKYSVLFNIDGLLNEYSGKAEVLRKGQLIQVDTLTEVEHFYGFRDFDKLECFVTSGGSSLAPSFYRKRLESYEYKTVRYPGHCRNLYVLKSLGFFEERPVHKPPRYILASLLDATLPPFDGRDLMLAQIDVTDKNHKGIRYELLDYHDSNFSAMERTTGFTTALIAFLMAKGAVAPGAYTPETVGFQPSFLEELGKRGIRVHAQELDGLS